MTSSDTTRVLIVKLSSLGDIFHALPTVHALKQQLDAEEHKIIMAMNTEPFRAAVKKFTSKSK